MKSAPGRLHLCRDTRCSASSSCRTCAKCRSIRSRISRRSRSSPTVRLCSPSTRRCRRTRCPNWSTTPRRIPASSPGEQRASARKGTSWRRRSSCTPVSTCCTCRIAAAVNCSPTSWPASSRSTPIPTRCRIFPPARPSCWPSSTAARHPDYPNVPVLKEHIPQIDFFAWFGCWRRPARQNRSSTSSRPRSPRSRGNPTSTATFLKLGLSPNGGTPEQMATLLKSDYERYRKLTTQLKLKIE